MEQHPLGAHEFSKSGDAVSGGIRPGVRGSKVWGYHGFAIKSNYVHGFAIKSNYVHGFAIKSNYIVRVKYLKICCGQFGGLPPS